MPNALTESITVLLKFKETQAQAQRYDTWGCLQGSSQEKITFRNSFKTAKDNR